MFRNEIRNRKVAYSYTLETKSVVNEKKTKKNEGYRNIETKKDIRSGQAFHYIDILYRST